MKCVLLTLVAFTAGMISLFAQGSDSLKVTAIPDNPVPQKHKPYQSLEIGAGYYSLPQISYILFAQDKERKLYTAPSPNLTGPFNICFSGYVSEKWEVCVSLSIDKIQGRLEKTIYVQDSVNTSQYDTVNAYANYSSKILALLVNCRYHWQQKGIVDLYSGFGTGIAFVSNDSYGQISTGKILDTYISLGLQLTFVGIRVGNKYGGFAEAGFGHLGAIHGGLSVRF